MPTQAIRREQRDALYREVMLDLADIGDVVLAVDNGHYPLARRLRARYEAEMRLLDLIGWEPYDSRETFELPLDTQLAGALVRLGRLGLGELLVRLEQAVEQNARRARRCAAERDGSSRLQRSARTALDPDRSA